MTSPSFFYAPVKRALDISGALVGLSLTMPLMVGAAGAIRLTMGSPVLFQQTRPGLHGVPFNMLKFRTMRHPKPGEAMIASDSRRLTKLGKFLRSSSIDELPELLNILRGDMSLVGPRPLLMRYLDRYTPEQARRHEIKPGLTGWAQVNGRNAVTWERKFELDLWYLEHRSLLLDAKIIVMTLGKVFARQDIQQEGQETTTEFMGSPQQT